MNKSKCQFLLDSIEYLGYGIDEHSIHQTAEKVDTILKARPPSNVSKLRSYLGLVNYYNMFIPNLLTLVEPLNGLLRKDAPLHWTKACQDSFEKLKQEIGSDCVLIPYDDELPLILATDASAFGIGACLSHRLPNGEERPILFTSRTLTNCEKDYSQLDKEATAIY